MCNTFVLKCLNNIEFTNIKLVLSVHLMINNVSSAAAEATHRRQRILQRTRYQVNFVTLSNIQNTHISIKHTH